MEEKYYGQILGVGPPFTIHPEETALLIIDMQTGFTQPDGPLYTPQSAEQLPTIADLKKFCNEKGIPV